ncbi:MAG: GNAT family N-acetyltransferase, partial [Bacteroidetes bacterium]
LMQIMQLNIPDAFAESEAKDFEHYLEQELEDYFVIEIDRKLAGGGGVNYFPEERSARISWDMLHPEYHKKGFGKQLTIHRINHIKNNPSISEIIVRTSQQAFQFYEKLGFILFRTKQDFWAKGYDLYEMRLQLL